ncbi:hypothetical protein HDU98_004619 [Podochytrium sp. JEL0797]|nr:hypothetical protein HDU98_004619 [Podochytrium sp. JEL0797]
MSHSATTPLFRGALVCLFFFAAELMAGVISGSLAILGDSMSLLQSALGFLLSLSAVHISTNWAATRSHTFGFARVELLGSMATVFLNWFLAIGLLFQSHAALVSPTPTVPNANIMLAVAITALLRNLVTLSILYPSSRPFKPEHTPLLIPESPPPPSTHSPPLLQPPIHNINLKTAVISTVSDTLASVVLLVGAVVLLQNPGWTVVDPICTILIALITFATTVGLVQQYLTIILEGVPKHLCIDTITSSLHTTFPFISHIHSIRLWSLTPGQEICLLHISVHPAPSLPPPRLVIPPTEWSLSVPMVQSPYSKQDFADPEPDLVSSLPNSSSILDPSTPSTNTTPSLQPHSSPLQPPPLTTSCSCATQAPHLHSDDTHHERQEGMKTAVRVHLGEVFGIREVWVEVSGGSGRRQTV